MRNRLASILRKIRSGLIDELFGLMLLYRVLRYRNPPKIVGTTSERFPHLYSGDPKLFYQPEPSSTGLEVRSSRVHELNGHMVDDLLFRSSTDAHFDESNTVTCRRWLPTDSRDTGCTLLLVDGLVQFDFSSQHAVAEICLQHGVELFGVDLPYNHRRTPKGYRPGQFIVGGDVDHAFAVLRQSVLDVWSAVRFLLSEGRTVALAGISLGGWTVLSVSLLESRLAAVTAITPPVDMLGVLTEGGVIVRAARKNLAIDRARINQLRPAAESISLLPWQPAIPAERIRLYAGQHDRFIPTPRIRELAAKWNCPLVVEPYGHIELTTFDHHLQRLTAEILPHSFPELISSKN
ncbi:alpha/beta hydrolase family protein [Calycomorphotria hydatis]|uniref:Alpha/beta hydrolase family protein n=1 Tax=Calycomorphotria hydatis TaxID=2528027 RepID=A0A517T6X8_9PLAN|nr:hypothetical protein [Calycomorphotria hydatis]QDT64134.1 Alpha/beta hydrolase family protein [Calycomorphotria hydatis]